MVREPVVFLLIEPKRLLGIAFLHTGYQFILFVNETIKSVDAEEILVVPDIHLIGSIEEALAKRQIIDRVKHVGLSCAIESDKTIHLLRKRQVGGFAVLEIGQSKLLEIHKGKA